MKTLKVNLASYENVALYKFVERIEELEIEEIADKTGMEVDAEKCNNALGTIYETIECNGVGSAGELTFEFNDKDYNEFCEFMDNIGERDLKEIKEYYNLKCDFEDLKASLWNVFDQILEEKGIL